MYVNPSFVSFFKIFFKGKMLPHYSLILVTSYLQLQWRFFVGFYSYQFYVFAETLHIFYLCKLQEMGDFQHAWQNASVMLVCVLGFLQLGALYANIRHDLRSEYNWEKSEHCEHQWSWVVWGCFKIPARVLWGRDPKKIFRF